MDDYTLLDENDPMLDRINQQMEEAGKSWPSKFTPYGPCPNCDSGTLKVAYSDMKGPALQCTNFDESEYNPKSTDRFRHDTGGDDGPSCSFRYVNIDLF